MREPRTLVHRGTVAPGRARRRATPPIGRTERIATSRVIPKRGPVTAITITYRSHTAFRNDTALENTP